MLYLFIAITISTMLAVAVIGFQLTKTLHRLGFDDKALSRWIYLGIIISFSKAIVPATNVAGGGAGILGNMIFRYFLSRDIYKVLANNIGNVLPILVYHKSFRLSFRIINTNRDTMETKNAVANMSMNSSHRSFPSLTEDYLSMQTL